MRIFLADDQHKVRSALRLLLENETGVQVVGEAVDAEGLLAGTTATCPDLVLLDWELPGLTDGTLSVLRRTHPGLCVIALSGRPEARRGALAAGADAFVSKANPPERLLAAIEKERRK